MLTLAAIARELDGKCMNRATVHIAAGLPLTWVATQKEDFQKYLLQNECVDFTFRNKEYHVEFAGADIYPQGFAAAFYRLQDFKGINMLVDIGNGTMNIMYINNSRPLEKKCFTEKYGTHQCVLAVRESLLKELGTVVDDLVDQIINNWLHFTKRLLVKFHRAYKSNDRLLDLHLLHQNIYKFCLQVPALY